MKPGKLYSRNIEGIKNICPALVAELDKIDNVGDIVLKKPPVCKVKPNYMTIILGAGKVAPLTPTTEMVVIVEPSSYYLKAMFQTVDLKKWLGPKRELIIINSSDKDIIRSFFYAYMKHDYRLVRARELVFQIREGLTTLENQFFSGAISIWEQCIPIVLTTFKSKIAHGIQGGVNFSKNATRYHIDFRPLKGALKGTPAIICSGGPSLDKDLESLKTFPGIIIAVDAVFDGLKKKGIKVDYVVSMDRDPKVALFYPEEKYEGSVFVCSGDVYPSIVDKFSPDVVYLPNLRQSILKGLDYDEIFEGGTCVAHLAFCFARWLGCGPIIICGQDFGSLQKMPTSNKEVGIHYVNYLPTAYGSLVSEPIGLLELEPYSGMVPEKKQRDEHWGEKYKHGFIFVENKLGQPFASLLAFVEMKTMFEDLIRRTPQPVINSSHGLKILGTQDIELKDVKFEREKFERKVFYKHRLSTVWKTEDVIAGLEMVEKIVDMLLGLDSLALFDETFNQILEDTMYKDVCYVYLSYWLICMMQDKVAIDLTKDSEEKKEQGKLAASKEFVSMSKTVVRCLIDGMKGDNSWVPKAEAMEGNITLERHLPRLPT